MRNLLYFLSLLNSSILFAQNELPFFIGYELRTSGPNMDHSYFIDKNVSSKVNLRGSLRKFDKVWNSPPPIFKIPLNGYSFGLDIEYMFKFNQYKLSLSTGTIAFKSRSYSNGGNTKLFVSPTTFFTVEANVFPKIFLGVRAGYLWFVNTDVYRNFNGIRHQEFSLFLKYQLKALNAERGF